MPNFAPATRRVCSAILQRLRRSGSSRGIAGAGAGKLRLGSRIISSGLSPPIHPKNNCRTPSAIRKSPTGRRLPKIRGLKIKARTSFQPPNRFTGLSGTGFIER